MDLVGREVTVELKNDLAIRGTLHSVDQYLNIKLENTRAVKYPHMGVGNFGPMTSMASAYMHPAGITQPVQCEVCNITCDTADVLETHKLGKKHLKNVQKQAVTSTIAQNMPSLTHANAPLVGKLEDKWHRILQNGASVDTLLHCDLCNVVCNNENAFQGHVATKKHVAKAIMQRASTGEAGAGEASTGEAGMGEAGTGEAGTGGGGRLLTPTSEGDGNPQPLSSNVFQCVLCKISCTSKELLNLHISGKKHQKKLKDSVQVPDPVEGTTIISNEVKPTSCEICGISCDTNEMLIIHFTGRKHQKKLRKLEKPSVPHKPVSTTDDGGEIATPMVVGELQDSFKDDKIVNEGGSIRKEKRAGNQIDLETKKQKIMEVGTAPASLRACTVCNVVCNSPKAFDYHMAGQEHHAMVAKQAKADTNQDTAEQVSTRPKRVTRLPTRFRE